MAWTSVGSGATPTPVSISTCRFRGYHAKMNETRYPNLRMHQVWDQRQRGKSLRLPGMTCVRPDDSRSMNCDWTPA